MRLSRLLIAVVTLALGCEAGFKTTSQTVEKHEPADAATVKAKGAEKKTRSKRSVTEWTTFSAPESGFSAKFPGKPEVKSMGEPGVYDATGVSYSAIGPRKLFASALVTTIPEEQLAGVDDDELVRQGLAVLVEGAEAGTEEASEVDMAGKTVRRTVFAATQDGRRLRVEARVFFVSPRLYQLQTTSVPGYSDSLGAEFFDSFKLLEEGT